MTAPTTVRLPPALRAEAESYAEAVGCSLSGLVGVALRDYLDARRSRGAAPVLPPSSVPAHDAPTRTVGAAAQPAAALAEASTAQPPKLGYHDPCWCGSGKKFGKCHGAGARRK